MIISSKCLLSWLIFFVVTVIYDGSFTLADKRSNDSQELDFEKWLSLNKERNDSYYSSLGEEERMLREQIWLENKNVVEKHNIAYEEGLTTWRMTMESPFADLTADEFTSLYLMDPQHCSATHTGTKSDTTTTIAKNIIEADDKEVFVDWRTKGIMTPIKDQGHCGSCWTFSTSGCLEAHTCLANNKDCTSWKGLAEQQLIDCAGNYNNFGCDGGLPSQAYEYIKYSGWGMDLESSYKYVASDGAQCLAQDGIVGAKVSEVYNITSGDETDLVNAIHTIGPVSIAYQVSPDFRLYQHGVYDSYNATTKSTMCKNTNQDVNHAVVAIGLGTTSDSKHNNNDDGGVPYYIVRNSWGTSWGMEGHFWMKRGENLCGVSDCASFPIVPTVSSSSVTQNDDEDMKDKEYKIDEDMNIKKEPNHDGDIIHNTGSDIGEQMLYLRKKK